ncbi:MAG: class I SAM-dependent methyltransferase [Desulfobacter sp.]
MTADPVQSHYASPGLAQKIRAGLEQSGKSIGALTTRDLAPVDQLHTGGAPATIALMDRAGLAPGATVLDAGCGIGGSSRLLAERYGFQVMGLDLAPDFVDAAQTLTGWIDGGPDLSIDFRQGSVLEIPCKDGVFHAVLCQHILMNIPDKAAVLDEFFRVLPPGGRLILHEITDGPGPAPHMPVPWASDAAISFTETWDTFGKRLEQAGFTLDFFSDDTENSARWWQKINRLTADAPPRPLHPGLVFGDNAALFGPNMEKNFSGRCVCCIEALLTKPLHT